MKTLTRDMTKGSPVKHILSFALAMLLGILFQQLYNMVDLMIVGKWIGVSALAGVGNTGSLNFLIVGFCNGLGTGLAIPISQSFGAGDYERMRKFAANSLWLSLMILPVLTVAVSFYCKDILLIMRTPADIFNYAYDYIFIIFLGLPILYTYNLLAAIMRALGDSKSPIIFLIISAGINVILDIISVGVLDMGVKGPAIATLISQFISVILCFIFIRKKFNILRIQKSEWRFDIRKIFTLLAMGIPMGLQYSITAIGSVVLQAAVNDLGTVAVSSMTTATKMSQFFTCPYEALGGTMATYAGQNTGAGDKKRIDKGVLSAAAIGIVYALFAFTIVFLFGKQLSLLFLDKSETEIISNIYKYLLINSISYILLSGVNVIRFTIQGMGYSMLAVIAGVFEMIARCVMGFVLVPAFGFTAACFASPFAWLLADVFLIPAYFICRYMMQRRFDRNARNTDTV